MEGGEEVGEVGGCVEEVEVDDGRWGEGGGGLVAGGGGGEGVEVFLVVGERG